VISQQKVWEAYKRVKANKGAAGVDGESLQGFEQDLEGESLQALESNVLGKLFSSACSNGRDTEEGRRTENARGAYCRR
jgi:retron-type reverse transcriptase